MQLPHIMRALNQDPWLITEAGYMAVADIVESRLSGRIGMSDDELLALAHRNGFERAAFGDDGGSYRTGYRVAGDCAIVPVVGTIVKGASNFQKSCGACAPEDIENDLRRALGDSAVQRVVMYVNSPGGHVRGVPELARKIAEWNGQKRIRGYIDGMGCSGAYYLLAGCHSVFATETSDVGSIGVVGAFVDESQAYAAAGKKVVMFTGGRLKGAGMPGTSLSAEAIAHMQERVGIMYDDFKAHVSAYRKRVSDDDMQGQSFMGKQAAAKGLIDGLADNLNEVIAKK